MIGCLWFAHQARVLLKLVLVREPVDSVSEGRHLGLVLTLQFCAVRCEMDVGASDGDDAGEKYGCDWRHSSFSYFFFLICRFNVVVFNELM
jgi:hypothetical protein